MINDYIQRIIDDYVSLEGKDVQVSVANITGEVIASTDASRIGKNSRTAIYVLTSKRSLLIDSLEKPSSEKTLTEVRVKYCLPLHIDNTIAGCVILTGEFENVKHLGDIIKIAIESVMKYHNYIDSIKSQPNETRIIRELLSGNPDREYVFTKIREMGVNDFLIYSVILIEYEEIKNEYFNIELNLGYSEHIQANRTKILRGISNNEYMTSRDIISFWGEKNIVILKSFLQVENISNVYIALDKICECLMEDLLEFNAYSFKISYGNTFTDIFFTSRSFNEAKEIMELGQAVHPEKRVFTLEDILFENVCVNLHPQIDNKLLVPYLQKLKNSEGKLDKELIFAVEKYVDCCLHMTKTAQELFCHRNTVDSRLQKFKTLTGLDPSQNYRDSFLAKMLAIYVRLNHL